MVAAVLKKVTAVESVLLLLAIRYLVFFLCCAVCIQCNLVTERTSAVQLESCIQCYLADFSG